MWYTKVTKDIAEIPNMLLYFEDQLLTAKKECSVYGNVEKNIRDLPGITEHRFNQLQEVEAVLNNAPQQIQGEAGNTYYLRPVGVESREFN